MTIMMTGIKTNPQNTGGWVVSLALPQPSLADNTAALLEGQYQRLLDTYKKRSLIIGREVSLFTDTPGEESRRITSGRVRDIGDNLEIFLENRREPCTRGRLVLAP